MPSTLAAGDYGRGIEEAWARVTTLVPKFLAFLVARNGTTKGTGREWT